MKVSELKDIKRKDYKSLESLFELVAVNCIDHNIYCGKCSCYRTIQLNCGHGQSHNQNYILNQISQISNSLEINSISKLSPYYVKADSVCKIENDYIEKLKNLDAENINLKRQLNEYFNKLAISQINETDYKNNIADFERENEYKNKIIKELEGIIIEPPVVIDDCYDIVIEANSLSALEESKGWDISYGKGGKEKYLKNKEISQSVIGVIGNFNKGKSFILQRLSGQNIAQGYSVSTKGLSIKYPEISNKPVSIIDSEGFETL